MKREILSVAGAAVVLIILAVLLSKGMIALSDVSAALAYVLVAAVFGILIWGFEPRIKRIVKGKSLEATDPRFAHLTIHYSQRTDTPDTREPARPRLVVDKKKKGYYWVPTWLEPYIKQHKIDWHTHDSGEALRAWLKKEKIEAHERDPITPEELGLKFDKHGSLLLAEDEVKSDLLSRLKGHRLHDFQVANLFPWYCFSISRLERYPSKKRLLLKFSTREAFESPLHDLELVENEILDSENYTRKFRESLERWCERYGYTFIRRRYHESELIEGERLENVPIDIPTFSEIDRIMSTEEMQNYRKIIYENAEIIKQAKKVSPELAKTINYVATRHDRVAVILRDRPNDKKRILEWIGEDTLLKTWRIIEPYVNYERHRRNNQNFILYYEQLMKEYEKEKSTS